MLLPTGGQLADVANGVSRCDFIYDFIYIIFAKKRRVKKNHLGPDY